MTAADTPLNTLNDVSDNMVETLALLHVVQVGASSAEGVDGEDLGLALSVVHERFRAALAALDKARRRLRDGEEARP
jgi:hypothetical protein